MLTFNVHEPPNVSANRLESAEQLVFVKDGYMVLAALVPPLWLLWKRMWLECAIYAAVTGVMVWALVSMGAEDVSNALLVIIQIVFGFEAGALYSASLERRGWRLVGTVSGRNAEDAERRFLETWLPTRTEIPEVAGGFSVAPRPHTSWPETALAQAKDVLARGRSMFARTAP